MGGGIISNTKHTGTLIGTFTHNGKIIATIQNYYGEKEKIILTKEEIDFDSNEFKEHFEEFMSGALFGTFDKKNKIGRDVYSLNMSEWWIKGYVYGFWHGSFKILSKLTEKMESTGASYHGGTGKMGVEKVETEMETS